MFKKDEIGKPILNGPNGIIKGGRKEINLQKKVRTKTNVKILVNRAIIHIDDKVICTEVMVYFVQMP